MPDRLQHIRDVPAGLFKRPEVIATFVAAICVIVGIFYIVVSDQIVKNMVTTMEELDWLQRIKGIGFMVFLGVGLWVSLYVVLRSLRNATVELSQRNRAVLLSEQRAMAGIFASSIAHDINNYLMVIIAELEALESGPCGPDIRENTKRLSEGLERLTRIATRLQHSGMASLPDIDSSGDLIELVETTVEFARGHCRIKSCDLKLDIRRHSSLQSSAVMVNQALTNLILNAAEITKGRGRIRVILDIEDHVPVLEVHDNGPGISAENRQRILEPFFTTKAGGTGLGLLSVKALADLHDGSVEIRDSELGGACFQLRLPNGLAVVPAGEGAPALATG